MVTLFYFYGFGYHASGPLPTWRTAQHGAPGNRFFGDDAEPTNLDPIMGYGSLGFGQSGTTPCPISDPDAVCCAVEGTCTITKQADCAAPSVWYGEWYVCTPNPCPQPTPGACCLASGACSMLTPAACASTGGVFHDGACEPNPCPQPGACCFLNGSCSTLQQAACAIALGTFYGGPCMPNPCPQPPAGACCLDTGACSMLTPVDCGSSGGVFHGGPCTPNPCPQPPTGACCFASGACSLLTPADCGSAGGAFHGGPCTPNPCPEVPSTGACCFAGGDCSIVTPEACASSGGNYYGGSCTPSPCPQPPSTGACCFAGGACSMLTPTACWSSGGTYYGGPCAPNPCPSPPPPAYCGADWASATVIPGLPYTGGGTTVGHANICDVVCPYTGSTSPEVVYAYVATGGVTAFSVDLCYSSYDTKVYIYDSIDTGSPIACNDDYYFAAPCYIYSSFVGPVPAVPGHTYYIVIDGYGGASGVYSMTVTDGGSAPSFGACCSAGGACTITTPSACAGSGRVRTRTATRTRARCRRRPRARLVP